MYLLPTDKPLRYSISYNRYVTSDVNLYNYYSCTRAELAESSSSFKNLFCTSHVNDIDIFYYDNIYIYILIRTQ